MCFLFRTGYGFYRLAAIRVNAIGRVQPAGTLSDGRQGALSTDYHVDTGEIVATVDGIDIAPIDPPDMVGSSFGGTGLEDMEDSAGFEDDDSLDHEP